MRLWRCYWEGGGVSMPSSPMVGSKTTPGASEVWFSSARGKQLATALGGIAPIGEFPVGAQCHGDHERAGFDRVQNPESFFQCLF